MGWRNGQSTRLSTGRRRRWRPGSLATTPLVKKRRGSLAKGAAKATNKEGDMAHAHGGGRSQGHRQRSTSGRWGGWSRPYRWGSTGYGGATYDPDLVSSVQACLAQTVGPWVPQNGRLGRATR